MPVTIRSQPHATTTTSSSYSTYNSGATGSSTAYARGRSPSYSSSSSSSALGTGLRTSRYTYAGGSRSSGGGSGLIAGYSNGGSNGGLGDDSAASSAGHSRFGHPKPPTGSTPSRYRSSTNAPAHDYGTSGSAASRASLSRFSSINNGSSSISNGSNGYHRHESSTTTSATNNDHYINHHHSHSHHNSASASASAKRNSLHHHHHQQLGPSALDRATAGADLYAKYSPSNYKPKTELSRSRSLSEGSRLGGLVGESTGNGSSNGSSSGSGSSSNGSSGNGLNGSDRGGAGNGVGGSVTGLNGGRLHHYGSGSRAASRDRDLDAATASITSKQPTTGPTKTTTATIAFAATVSATGNNRQPLVHRASVAGSATGGVPRQLPTLVARGSPKSMTTTGSQSANAASNSSPSNSNISNNNNNNNHNNNNTSSSSSCSPPSAGVATSATQFYAQNGVNPIAVQTNFLQAEFETLRQQLVQRVEAASASTTATASPAGRSRSAAQSGHRDAGDSNNNNQNGNGGIGGGGTSNMDDIKYIDSDDSGEHHHHLHHHHHHQHHPHQYLQQQQQHSQPSQLYHGRSRPAGLSPCRGGTVASVKEYYNELSRAGSGSSGRLRETVDPASIMSIKKLTIGNGPVTNGTNGTNGPMLTNGTGPTAASNGLSNGARTNGPNGLANGRLTAPIPTASISAIPAGTGRRLPATPTKAPGLLANGALMAPITVPTVLTAAASPTAPVAIGGAEVISRSATPTPTEEVGVDGEAGGGVRNASLRGSAAVGGATSLGSQKSSTSPSRYGTWEREGRSSLLNGRTQSDSVAVAGATGTSSSSSDLAAPSSSSSSSYLRSSGSLYGDRGSADDSDGLCGLRNIGNTCFMNSVIQCLSHTRELATYLRDSTDTRSATKDQRIFYEFAKLIREMWSPRQRTMTPSELKSAVSSKHRMYSGCAQQDAQEFLRFFLDSLHNASNTGVKGAKLEMDESLPDQRQAEVMWQWYTRVENSVVQDLFVGQFKSALKCTVCGNTSVTFDPFWDLSVPLQSSSRCKLESCLDFFIKEEVLDGDEMPTCSKCKTRRKSTKSFTIQRFPKYLVIHLKRFSETRWSKLTNIVEFPTAEGGLDMAPYAASGSPSAKYTLYGISNHMGSTAGGHYVAMCKHPATKKWHEFNDNIVSDASESQLVSSSAYLLFYERVTNALVSEGQSSHSSSNAAAHLATIDRLLRRFGSNSSAGKRWQRIRQWPTVVGAGEVPTARTLRDIAQLPMAEASLMAQAALGLGFYAILGYLVWLCWK